MNRWTSDLVAGALKEAAVARREIEGSAANHVDPTAVGAMTATAGWTAMLDDTDAQIVRLRSSGTRWKPICWQLGIGRATAHRRFNSALRRIAEHLNAIRAC